MELVEATECDYFEKSKKTLNILSERTTLPDGAIVTVLGILFHCAADGFAFGASGYSIFILSLRVLLVKGFSFGFLIFIALMLHKAPEAFSVGAFLLHEKCARALVYKTVTVCF